MSRAALLRLEIESALARRIPSALTPQVKVVRPLAATGIAPLDRLLGGGLPVGALSELAGPPCCGRTTIGLALVARMTREGRVCAWIDVSNAMDPSAAAGTGIDLDRLLWVRCGAAPRTTLQRAADMSLPAARLRAPAARQGIYGGGWGPHPRSEVRGLSQAVEGLFSPQSAPAQAGMAGSPPAAMLVQTALQTAAPRDAPRKKPWSRMEQAMRSADLLLQAGGFSVVVMDMGSLTPEAVARVPLATWHRYRVAAERTQACFLLLTQHASAKSSAEVVLRLEPAAVRGEPARVLTGVEVQAELLRQRFTPTADNVVPLRKPPQSATAAAHARWTWPMAWAACR